MEDHSVAHTGGSYTAKVFWGMNPILKGKRFMAVFYRINSNYPKTSVPEALQNGSPISCTLVVLSRNLPAERWLNNTRDSNNLGLSRTEASATENYLCYSEAAFISHLGQVDMLLFLPVLDYDVSTN